jgi:hypothetical protein
MQKKKHVVIWEQKIGASWVSQLLRVRVARVWQQQQVIVLTVQAVSLKF